MNYGNTLKKARRLRGLSLQALADRMGVSKPRVAHFELQKHRPQADTHSRILEALGVPEELFNLIGAPAEDLVRITPAQRDVLARGLVDFINDSED